MQLSQHSTNTTDNNEKCKEPIIERKNQQYQYICNLNQNVWRSGTIHFFNDHQLNTRIATGI